MCCQMPHVLDRIHVPRLESYAQAVGQFMWFHSYGPTVGTWFHIYRWHSGDFSIDVQYLCPGSGKTCHVFYSRNVSQRSLRASYALEHGRACSLKFPSRDTSFTRPNLSNVSNALPMGISTCIQLTQESPGFHDLFDQRMVSLPTFSMNLSYMNLSHVSLMLFVQAACIVNKPWDLRNRY